MYRFLVERFASLYEVRGGKFQPQVGGGVVLADLVHHFRTIFDLAALDRHVAVQMSP